MPLTDAACRNARCPDDRGFKRFSDAHVAVSGSDRHRREAVAIEVPIRREGKAARACGLQPAVYLPERKKLMQQWASYLDAIREADAVVPIRRKQVKAA